MGKLRSNEEDVFRTELNLLKKAGEVVGYAYEKHTFEIGVSRTYKPDFFVEYKDRIEVTECKGFPLIFTPCRWCRKKTRNHVAESKARELGINKFMTAAWLYPKVGGAKKPVFWRLIELDKGCWKTIYLVRNGEKVKKPFLLHAKEIKGI